MTSMNYCVLVQTQTPFSSCDVSHCREGLTWDPVECVCYQRKFTPVCENFICRLPKNLNPESCECSCPPKICAVGRELNTDTCECEDVRSITVSTNDGSCDDFCPDNKYLSPTTCRCECNSIRCHSGESFNPENCVCTKTIVTTVCGEIDCLDYKIANPDTCDCDCRYPCGFAEFQDPTTCKCS